MTECGYKKAANSLRSLFVLEYDCLALSQIEVYDRLCQRDLVEDEVVADGADELAHARAFLRKDIGEVVDRAGGFDRVPTRTDVFHRVVVWHGAEGNVWIRGKLDDFLVVLQRGEVDALLLR